MSGINRVILIGNLGKDPEVKHLDGGNKLARLRLATSEAWTDKDGQRQERTEWHDVVAWGVLADNVGKFLAKGSKVYVDGRIRTRKWTTKEGQERTSTEVVANTVEFLDSRGREHSSSASSQAMPEAPEAPF